MCKKAWYLVGIITLLATLSISIYKTHPTSAASPHPQQTDQNPGIQVIQATYVGVSEPLRSIPPISSKANTFEPPVELQDRLSIPKTHNSSDGSFDASIVQMSQGGLSMPAPIVNLEGINNINGVYPPDTQGDIGYDPATGKKYYIQWVNLSFEIWDVTNPSNIISVGGPYAGDTLWTGTGTICETHNDGDVITLYDHLANRWFMSQFALGNNNFHQCIVVSTSADPTSAWYQYDFQTSTSDMNDYPKFGVWPDGYYMTVNQFLRGKWWSGAGVAVFERTAMLAGQTARMIYIDIGAITLDYGGMLPSDLDGPAPAAGTPNYFMEWDDSTWLGDAADTIRIWEFHTDWSNPANSTFGANSSYDPNLMITTADVNPTLCGSLVCIPQPGTTQMLDEISDRLMYRLQYRNFGTYKTLLTNHTVNADGNGNGGVHWFELRDTGSGFAMYQQGLYAPDTDSRWMGSVAMDASGDIALGFSVSSSTTYPSIRYTGRLAADPLGSLPQGEVSLMAGSGSQTGIDGRWGDYSMMGLDETDGCTFWYTQEYIATTGGAPWRTRIGAFKFLSCSPPTAVTLDGTVSDASSAPITGATIDVSGGYSTITDEAGHYALSLEDGVYEVTASKYGYFPSTVPGVLVEPPGTRQDFTLAKAPVHALSGVVTDEAGGWPLYVRINISGFPGGPIFTDPLTGAYALQLAEGTYNLTINALSGGYLPSFQSLIVTADTHQDFTLAADLLACTAPGYASSPAGAMEYLGDSSQAACAPIPAHGLVIGGIYDANTGEAAANPRVEDIDTNPALLIDNSADALQVHPLYIISEPVGSAILTASAPNYSSSTQSANVLEYEITRQDFDLPAGMLSTHPDSLSYNVSIQEPTAAKSLTLSDTGGAAANFEVFTVPGNFEGYAQVGPFAPHTRHFGPKNLYDLDASHIRMDLTPRDVSHIVGGNVSASWPTGLAYAWGIGLNTDAADLWLGDLLASSGDGFNHRFTIDGADTGDTIDTSSWVGLWNADMTYNPFSHKLWQVNVGGDECIYELDPLTKTSTGNKICPPFGTSERGLAFDPLTGSYYSGSWNDGIINHFAPDGTLIDSADVSLNISGLAFNPNTGHLFALTSNDHLDNAYDVYVLDTQDAYDILGGFNMMDHGLEAMTPFGQAGLEIDCAGNLWAVDQYAQKVFGADSGETGICDWQATWLSVNPTKGTLNAGGDATLNIKVDATGMPAGTYQAYLRVVGDTPYGDTIVPVTLNNYTLQFLPVVNR